MKKLLLLIAGAGLLVFGLQARAQVLLATTNQGELVEVDLAAGTATLLGDAGQLPGKDKEAGWTGISFDAAGDLYVVSRQSSEPETGCTGSPANTEMRCAHLYRIDPASGAVLAELGNTQMPFVSDIDFAAGGALYGSQWDGRGALITVNAAVGTGSIVNYFGTKLDSAGGAIDIQNGGLSFHPVTGELWAIESDFGTNEDGVPSIFRVDAATGMVIPPVVPLGESGALATFGFDSLEILPDGRFIASRAGGRNDIYEIDPNPDASSGLAEATLVPIVLDPAISGSMNGLEFSQTSPDQVQSLIDDIYDMGLPTRTERRLVAHLEYVRNRLDRDLPDDARAGLCDFIDRLAFEHSRGRIQSSDASALLKEASNILGRIGFD